MFRNQDLELKTAAEHLSCCLTAQSKSCLQTVTLSAGTDDTATLPRDCSALSSPDRFRGTGPVSVSVERHSTKKARRVRVAGYRGRTLEGPEQREG